MVNVRLIPPESSVKIARALCFYNAEHSGKYWDRRNKISCAKTGVSRGRIAKRQIFKRDLFPAAEIAAFEIVGIDIGRKPRIFAQKNHGCSLLEVDPLPAGTFSRHRRPAIDPNGFRPCCGCTA